MRIVATYPASCSVWFDDAQLYEDLSWKTYYPNEIVVELGDSTSGVPPELMSDNGDYFELGSELDGGNQKIDWYGETKTLEDQSEVWGLSVAYDGHYTQEDYILLYNWGTTTYDTLCATSSTDSCWNYIRQADITQGWSTTDTSVARSYISYPGKQIRMRVLIEPEASTDTCTCWADYMKFSVRYDPD
jgi:hypothetical protein